jgi:hypothetical protein
MSHLVSFYCDMFPLIFNGSQIMSEAPRDTERDMLIGDHVELLLENLDRQLSESRKAAQAAGLDYRTPRHIKQVEEAAEKFCLLVKFSPKEEWRQLGRLVHAGIYGDGPPAHRPPSSAIAKRNADIIEKVEFFRAHRRQMKTIFSDIGREWELSARAVKKIWDARERKAT